MSLAACYTLSMLSTRRFALLFILAAVLNAGTTYVIVEDGKEVGRWIEPDGKSEVVEVAQDKARIPATNKTPSRPAPVKEYDWWQDGKGYDRAAQEYAASKKPALLYFHATWCPYCKKLEKDVFADRKVQAYLKDVVKVKIDAEKEPKLARLFNVSSYPRVFLVDLGSGKSERLKTYVTPDEFIRNCNAAGLKAASS